MLYDGLKVCLLKNRMISSGAEAIGQETQDSYCTGLEGLGMRECFGVF